MAYNPERLKTGNKILRQRLKGPSMVEYYPERPPQMKDLRRLYPDLVTWDDDEEERLEALDMYEFHYMRFLEQKELIICSTAGKKKAKERRRRRELKSVS